MSSREQDGSDVYRITSATGARSADMQQRAGRYLVSMLIRTICVVLVIIVPGPLRWVFAVGAIVLPYVAVIAANSAGERRERPLPPPPPGVGRSLPGPDRGSAVQRPPDVPRARSSADRQAS